MNKLLTGIIPAIFMVILQGCNRHFDGKNGVSETYDPASKKLLQRIEYKDGRMNGWCEEYYENGNLRSKGYYVNDTLRDTMQYFHKNGQVSSIQIYAHGRKNGCWKKFSEKGVLWSEICYEDHSLNGPSNRNTYITGKPYERLNYVNGSMVGKQEYFYNSGKKKSLFYMNTRNQCTSLHEWYESGKEINNDFKISFAERNTVVFNGEFTLIVKLENPRPDDRVDEILDEGDSVFTTLGFFKKSGDHFERTYYVSRGAMLVQKIKVAAHRKTGMGNKMIKTATYNMYVNNL